MFEPITFLVAFAIYFRIAIKFVFQGASFAFQLSHMHMAIIWALLGSSGGFLVILPSKTLTEQKP
jgi:hypothetical protein